ncbi:MAG: ADP-ribosylation factor-like protein [Promethearchaeota archaeon]
MGKKRRKKSTRAAVSNKEATKIKNKDAVKEKKEDTTSKTDDKGVESKKKSEIGSSGKGDGGEKEILEKIEWRADEVKDKSVQKKGVIKKDAKKKPKSKGEKVIKQKAVKEVKKDVKQEINKKDIAMDKKADGKDDDADIDEENFKFPDIVIDKIVEEEMLDSSSLDLAKPEVDTPPVENITTKPPDDITDEDVARELKEMGIIDDDAAPDLVELMKAQKEKPREAWKILFSGLDFAGKSSILATIKHEFKKLINPQPTKLTERDTFTFLGQEISEWDLGGQRLYRIQYLKRPLQYYADTSILFYIIDVLDEERYEEAIDFLYDTLQLFDKLNINPLISIFFHKMDPEIERESKKNRIELKLTALKNKIKVLTYGRDVLFFRTSIFNRYSIIEGFSKSLLELYPDKNIVDYVLAELAVKTKANIIILLDENRLILGQNIISSEDRQYEDLVQLAKDTLISFLYLHENFKLYPFLSSNYMIIQLEHFAFLWVKIEEKGHQFYIIVFKDGADFQSLLDMDVQSVGKILLKLIK